MCDSKKAKFIKEQEASGLEKIIKWIGINTPLNENTLLGPLLF